MINIEVTKQNNENNMSMIRRFTRRVRSSGIVNRVRGLRYHSRAVSKFARKTSRLNSLARRAEMEELMKLGRVKSSR